MHISFCFALFIARKDVYSTNMNENRPKEDAQNRAWNKDIMETRRNPHLAGAELPMRMSEDLIRKIDELLTEREPQSKEELDEIIQELDVASAINNDPKARELRAELLKIYGK